MAKITRETAKIFGETATSTGADPAIGQFGSGKAGTYVGTGDIATIQGLAAWSNGWIDAVTPTQQFPALPEMTGVHKVLSYQNAYILQEGVAEYDASTVYYTDSLVKARNSSNEVSLYKSLVDNNTGNAVTNTTYWKEIPLEGWADTNLSNLTTTGNNRLHALKGYEDAGELLTDPEGLADVLYYYHSTFDNTSFAKNGTPTFVNGVASGFGNSGSNYIYSSQGLPSSFDTFEIYLGKYNFSSKAANDWIMANSPTLTPSGGFMIRTAVSSSRVTFALWLGTSGNWDIASSKASITSNYINNNTFELKLVFTGSKYILYVKADDNDWVEEVSVDSTSKIASGLNFYIAPSTTAHAYTYDAKYFSIKVNGYPYFSGNKTGIDTIKADNYTVVGTPTISADGVASGFAGSSYVQIPTLTINTNKAFIISGKIKTGSDITTNQAFLGINQSGSSAILLDNRVSGGNLVFIYATSASGNALFTVPCTTNTEYTYTIEYDGTNLVYTINGTAQSPITTFYSTDFGYINLGRSREGATSGYEIPFLGSIDLNAFKIYVDGDLKYQPCLKIPYTLSKTGSKVVDSVYRDRVSDMYEQYGKAPYYTLSDIDFTLPQGEIYGLMSTVIETYKNGASWYRVYADGWCEQGGYLATDSTSVKSYTVNFLKSFVDTNYSFNRSPYWAIDTATTITSIYDNGYRSKTSSSISFYMHESTIQNGTEWSACGYIN